MEDLAMLVFYLPFIILEAVLEAQTDGHEAARKPAARREIR
jgi:hypothetical protein